MENRHKGIDVSSNNGIVNWDAIKLSDIEFAIIRIGYGNDEINQDDAQAIDNMHACEERGIPYGVYLYSYALNIDEVNSEAAHALRMVKFRNPELGIWFDMEDADGYKKRNGIDVYKEREIISDFCCTFCNIIENAGYQTGIYASMDYFRNVFIEERICKYNKWVAQWNVTVPSVACLMWQYTSKGEVNGSSKRTDMNYYYGNLPKVEVQKICKKNKVMVVKDACDVGGTHLAAFVYNQIFDVLFVSGDKALIGINNVVTARMYLKDLQRIK